MPVTTRSATKKAREQHVWTAPPPWHSVLLVVVFLAIFVKLLPSFESLDQQAATVETFTKRLFPNHVSLKALVVLRIVLTVGMVALQVHAIVLGNGWEQITTYMPSSKLKRHVLIPMHGFRTMLPFTSWAWNLLALSFGFNACISYQALVSANDTTVVVVEPWMLRTAVLLFETASPTALLVAFVVRYGIWPQVLSHGTGKNPTSALKHPRTLLWHNANVIMALTEVSLLGGLPVRYADFSISALFGLLYICFSWMTMHYWAPGAGPQFLYFFFDTTLGKTTSMALVVLLVALMVFYGLFCVLHQILDHLGGGPLVHGLAVVLLSSAVCRFRD